MATLAELKNMQFDAASPAPITIKGSVNDRWYCVFNDDADEPAAIVGKNYNIIQHNEVKDAVVDALSNLNLGKNCSVNAWNDRNRMVIDINFPSLQQKLTKVGEEFMRGMRIINSYNKTTGIMIAPRLVRLACSNGMTVDVAMGKFSVRHNTEKALNFQQEIPRVLKVMTARSKKFEEYVNACIGESVEWELIEKILPKFMKRKKHSDAILARLKTEMADKKKKHLSRWDVYNAFTAYATHGQQIKPAMEMWLQKKAQIVLTTPIELLATVSDEAEE